jgi:D-sedoheptulose 7-phosphate isomerase
MNINKYTNDKKNKEISKLIKNLRLLKKLDKKEIFTNLINEGFKTLKNKGKIVFFGNGGSASDAQHLATELTVRYKKNRKALAAISLATDTSTLTAIGNDFSFEEIFSRQIEAICNKNDLAIGITTSGNSKNIIKAIKQCQKQKITVFILVGNNGGRVKQLTKNIIPFPKTATSHVQTMQIFLGQLFCEIMEEKLT